MKRFALVAVVGSVRQVLAITIALLAAAGAGYLVSHRLSNPDHYAYGSCFHGPYTIVHGLIIQHGSCNPPSRAAWQIPLAVALAILGLGAAVAVAGDTVVRGPRESPDPLARLRRRAPEEAPTP
jgi:hypothetical protein